MTAETQEFRYILRGLSALALVMGLALLWSALPKAEESEPDLSARDVPPAEEIVNVRAPLTYALHRAYHTAWMLELDKRPRPLVCATLSTGQSEAYYMLSPIEPQLSLSPLLPVPWDVQMICYETNKLMAV